MALEAESTNHHFKDVAGEIDIATTILLAATMKKIEKQSGKVRSEGPYLDDVGKISSSNEGTKITYCRQRHL